MIQAYEDGLMAHGSTTYFKGEKTVSEAEAAMRDDFVWEEVRSVFHLPKFGWHNAFKSLTVAKS